MAEPSPTIADLLKADADVTATVAGYLADRTSDPREIGEGITLDIATVVLASWLQRALGSVNRAS